MPGDPDRTVPTPDPELAPPPGHVLLVRGVGPLGRAFVRAIDEAGGRPSVIDRRTSVSGATAARVDLADPSATGRAIDALVREHGLIDAVVVCPSPERPARDPDAPDRWERRLAADLVEVATVLRVALPRTRSVARCSLLVGAPDGADEHPAQRTLDEVSVAFVRGLLEELAPTARLTVRAQPAPAGPIDPVLYQHLPTADRSRRRPIPALTAGRPARPATTRAADTRNAGSAGPSVRRPRP